MATLVALFSIGWRRVSHTHPSIFHFGISAKPVREKCAKNVFKRPPKWRRKCGIPLSVRQLRFSSTPELLSFQSKHGVLNGFAS